MKCKLGFRAVAPGRAEWSQRSPGSTDGASWLRVVIYVVPIALAVAAGFTPQAKAGTIAYPLSAFTLVNTDADGSMASSDGITATITGGNSGSGLDGTTDLITVAVSDAIIEFHWVYMSLDMPSYDFGGYLLDTTFTILADTSGMQGTTSFTVLAGQTFGFRVETADNGGEPGLFTVSSFNPPARVPEPASGVLIVVAAAVLVIVQVKSLHRHGGRQI
jgi:hypothetical protein